ncbi:MAG: UDP-N-acetylmuramate--L-alanine ligase [Clostridia bacterium]|nr:UDP-N-acetylmuramate--L-alanine ligase [Clostridia bacterium]
MMIPHIRDYVGKRIHMIGIGGSSMSGLAQMLIAKGYQVSGSDRSEGYLIGDVRAAGAKVYIGHAAQQVHGADLVVYTGAAASDNPERLEADRLGIPSMERSVLLGQLMEGYPHAVGICGAHGKTSTTSMLSQVLVECGLDPSVHIGGKLDAIGGSTRIGAGDAFLAEACEFRRSFLEMRPTIAVVLNIDADHLDCYKDIDEIEATFGQFMGLVPADGMVIGKGTDERVLRQMKRLTCPTLTFGMTTDCDFHPANLTEDELGCASFDLIGNWRKLAHVQLAVPGDFNVENALAALTTAYVLGADMERAAESIGRFVGAHRRFEKTDEINGGAEIFHDYGHNPAEMRNAVSIARKRCKGTLYAVMQPHTFSRVRTLFNDYLTCTRQADVTVVMDICAAREKDPGDLNSGMLVDGMKAHGVNAVWTPSFDDTEAYLRAHLKPGDLAITMGCGDVNMLNEQIHRHEVEAGRA